jgi:hypothetical protein
MNEKQFRDKQKVLLSGIPEEFRGMVAYNAWDRGHSYGYDEVLIHVSNYVEDLKKPIAAFEARIKRL